MDRAEGFLRGTHMIVAQGRVLALRVVILGLSVAILLMPVCTFLQSAQAAAQEPAPSPAIVTPDQLIWKPLMPGLELAVVSGDPDKKGGLYVIRIRAKREVKIPPHWHVTDEHVTVLVH